LALGSCFSRYLQRRVCLDLGCYLWTDTTHQAFSEEDGRRIRGRFLQHNCVWYYMGKCFHAVGLYDLPCQRPWSQCLEFPWVHAKSRVHLERMGNVCAASSFLLRPVRSICDDNSICTVSSTHSDHGNFRIPGCPFWGFLRVWVQARV